MPHGGPRADIMAIDSFFSGSALRAVDADGGTILPPFVLRVFERRGSPSRAVLGPHEADPCISGYDEGSEVSLFAEMERRRLREDGEGLGFAAHHARARRAFGAVERADFDGSGRMVLPPMARRRSRIGSVALFVGVGGSFELWDPQVARASGDETLRQLLELADLNRNGVSEGETRG